MALALDVVLLALIAAALYAGWRQGALASVLSALGVLAGLVVGFAFTPLVVRVFDSTPARLGILMVVVAALVSLGNVVGAAAGSQLRERVRRGPARWADSAFGAVFLGLVVTLALWFISIPLASALPGAPGDALRGSKVLSRVDAAAPPGMSTIPSRLTALLDESGLPPLVSPFHDPRSAHVDVPDAAALDPNVIEQTRPSVVQVVGDASSCQRRLTGTGFVVEDDYVLTNAHVVAGTDTVSLDTVVGVKKARVVEYDPDTDVAVLYAERLGLDPLPWSSAELESGDDAVVMGFPLSGPFEAEPARIRGRLSISGPDIYAHGRVEREAYTLRANIRQGNSGGPLLTPAGEVAGMIFGASVDSSDTGYALTAKQVRDRIGDVGSLTGGVDTQACVGAS